MKQEKDKHPKVALKELDEKDLKRVVGGVATREPCACDCSGEACAC